jgi:hypothetical protein
VADSAAAEFDRQRQRLIEAGYPELAGRSTAAFTSLLEPVREVALQVPAVDPSVGGIPFVIVVRDTVVPSARAVERFSVRGRPGWTDMAAELAGYRPIEGVEVPDAAAYLLVDVDPGRDRQGVTPDDALPGIRASGRTPPTIDEGIALVTQFPDLLTTGSAFQALGSRAPNRRVPTFWMSKGAPRLGWCWAGNPHSWLGAASAGRRLMTPNP